MKDFIRILLYVLLALLVVAIITMIYKRFKTEPELNTEAETMLENSYSDTSILNLQNQAMTAEDSMILDLTGELPNKVGQPLEDVTHGSDLDYTSNTPVHASPAADEGTPIKTASPSSAKQETNKAVGKSDAGPVINTPVAKTVAKPSTESKTAAKKEVKQEKAQKEAKAVKASEVSVKTKAETKTSSTASKTNTATKTSALGKYMVVTGSFSTKENADNAVAELKKKGFANAKRVVINNLHRAVAANSDDRSKAEAELKKAKSKGIKDAYIPK